MALISRADAAHQLRTPIAGIRAQAEAALTSSQPQAGAQMGNLVQKLLMLARVDAAENTLQLHRLDSAEVIGLISREWAQRCSLLPWKLDYQQKKKPHRLWAMYSYCSRAIKNRAEGRGFKYDYFNFIRLLFLS